MNPKKFSIIAITLFSIQSFAAETIKVTVNTNEASAAGIGYSVNGKKSGAAGKTYSGNGPANSKYTFGYRKDSAHGANVSCGSHTLTKSSNITLVSKGSQCKSIVE